MKMGRYSNRLRPVNSIKHIVDIQGGLIVNTQVDEELIVAVDSTVSTSNPFHVEKGCTVSSLFLNVQVAATSTSALANVYMAVMKSPGDNISVPQVNTIGTSDERRFVIHQEMIMTEKNTTAIPRTLFKGVIKIPRGYKRFGIKDKLYLSLKSPGVSYDYCIQAIYKEFK